MTQPAAEPALRCTAADGLRLNVRRWESEETAKALLVVIHGIVEHSGRYAEMAYALNRASIAVWAPDLRGHGQSSGDRVWVDRFDRYAEDLARVAAEARDCHPGLPLFLFGHSMGAMVALRCLSVLPETPKGAILSAPPISVAENVFPWLRKLAAFGSRWFPKLRLVRMGTSLSRDPEVVAQFRNDPLVFHGRIPTRTGAEILRVADHMRRSASEVTIPLLILQGTADALVSPEATEAFYHAAGSGDKTLRLYPDLYHDLPREPENEEIYQEIIHWIRGRC